MSNIKLRIETEEINDESRSYAQKSLRETPKTMENGLIELRKLLIEDNTINFEDDDNFLIIFLRLCKFYPQSAFELMKRVVKFKLQYQHILHDLLPTTIKDEFVSNTLVNVLKDRDQLGRRIFVMHCGGRWNPNEVPSDSLFKCLYTLHEAVVLEPETQVRGVVVILDFSHLSRIQLRAFNRAFCFQLLSFMQDAAALRFREVHILYQPYSFNMLYPALKPFMRDKLRSRTHLHGYDLTNFHTYIHPSYLPVDFGGCLPEINYNCNDWYPALETKIDLFRMWDKFQLNKGSLLHK